MGISDRLKAIDAHSSVSNEFRVYTVQGAVISIMTLLSIAYLVVTEVYFNFQVTLQERVHVNSTSPRGIEMEFDISLPEVPCSLLSIDAADPSGQPQSLHLDSEHHTWKHRFKMSDDGQHKILIGHKAKLELGSTMLDEYDLEEILDEKVIDDDDWEDDEIDEEEWTKEEIEEREKRKRRRAEQACGSCYGAGEEGECCNSCEDVKRAYKRMGWVLRDTSNIKQCNKEKRKEEEHEGCNVHGVVALSSGGGNLHLAPHKESYGADATPRDNIFEMLLESFQQWNVSHTVHKLRFGPEYPAAVNQLDGETRIVSDTSSMYQYYIQVVPTLYRFRNGTTIQTNQFSVTEHTRHVLPHSSRGLPGVFFFYEVSPLHVEIIEGHRKGWIAFFTSVCAIIGGVVTFMGMIDQYMFTRKGDKSRQGLAF